MPHKDRGQSRGPGHRGPSHHGGKGQNGGFPNGGRGGFFGHGGVPVLTYFDGEGLAEQIRLTFTVGGVNFVDRRIKDHAEFEAKYQSFTPHGQLPILEVDGETIVQSGAILAYAARRAGLEPESALDRDHARAVQSMIIELHSVGDTVSPNMSLQERRSTMMARLGAKLPSICERIESIISPSTNGYLFGETLSYADIAIHCMIRSSRVYTPEAVDKLDEKYPKISSVYACVDNHPAVKRHRAEKAAFKPKLYYFNGEGAALSIRWAFEVAGIEYEDVRFTFAEWPEWKSKFPGGVVPVLEIAEGEYLNESLAILIHAARKAGLVPWKETQFAHAYSVCLTVVPAAAILRTIYTVDDPVEKAKNTTIANEETLPAMLKRLEAIIALKQSKQGYIVGDRLSFADLFAAACMHNLASRHLGVAIKDLWSAYPNTRKVYELVAAHPAVAKYFLRSPVATPKLVYFDIAARAEAIRQMFKYGNIEFEDYRMAHDDWQSTLKAQTVTGKAPYLDIGTDRIYETIACVQYAAEKANLVPRSWQARAQAMALYSVYDGTITVRSSVYSAPAGPERDALVRERKSAFANAFEIYEKLLATAQSPEGYSVGGELSYIDYYVAYETDYIVGCTKWLDDDWAEKYPHTAKLHKLVMSTRR